MTDIRSDVPVFEHDCPKCDFLGHGHAAILGPHRSGFDFYVCGSTKDRSFIARYGDKREQYMSGGLFECVELTALDKVALFNGLELTPEENERLLRVLGRMWRHGLTMKDYEKMSVGGDLTFGSGNVIWGND